MKGFLIVLFNNTSTGSDAVRRMFYGCKWAFVQGIRQWFWPRLRQYSLWGLWPVVPEAPVCFSSLWTLTLHWSAGWPRADRTLSSSWSSVCPSFGHDPPSHYKQKSTGVIKSTPIQLYRRRFDTTPLTSWVLHRDAAGADVWSPVAKDRTAPWTYRRSPARVSFQTGSQHYSRHLSSSCASSGGRCLQLAAPCASEALPDDCRKQWGRLHDQHLNVINTERTCQMLIMTQLMASC